MSKSPRLIEKNSAKLELPWVAAKDGDIPDRAIEAGFGVFVARATYNKELIPGKIVRGYSQASVSYGGKEHGVSEYEVLCDTPGSSSYTWERYDGNNLPPGAVEGGKAGNGLPYYVGRTRFQGEMVSGKVFMDPIHKCLYFPYDNLEKWTYDFEVLVVKK